MGDLRVRNLFGFGSWESPFYWCFPSVGETYYYRYRRFWTRWLMATCAGVIAFGMALVVLPEYSCSGFSKMMYGDSSRVSKFGAEAVKYVQLSQAVMGSVMVGWGVMLFVLSKRLSEHNSRDDWNLIVASLAAWFIPDTTFSLVSGFWPNAVLNAAFAGVFAAPLIALRPKSTRGMVTLQ